MSAQLNGIAQQKVRIRLERSFGRKYDPKISFLIIEILRFLFRFSSSSLEQKIQHGCARCLKAFMNNGVSSEFILHYFSRPELFRHCELLSGASYGKTDIRKCLPRNFSLITSPQSPVSSCFFLFFAT